MGMVNFKWGQPGASDVLVIVCESSDFLHGPLTTLLFERLSKKDGIFEKELEIPGTKKDVCFRFRVDGKWRVDLAAPLARALDGQLWNMHGTHKFWWQDPPALSVPSTVRSPQYIDVHRPPKPPTKSYQYRPLDFDSYEIRILTFDSEPSQRTKIACSMEHDSLIDPSPYIALSYCWGSPNTTVPILLGGCDAHVTTNLDAALRGVLEYQKARRPVRSKALTRLWVDALCINQKDGQERSQQVRNMRQIYSKARHVIAWIGADDLPTEIDDDHYAVQTWRCIERMKQRLGKPGTTIKWTEAEWMALSQFFSRPYWQRVWVIQEITVGQKVTVLYGDLDFAWEDVAELLTIMQETTAGLELPRNEAFMNAVHLLQFRDNFTVQRNPISLLDAMRWSSKTLSTDPRDKIFALLGMCHDGSTFVPVPNYKQPFEVIMADISGTMMILNKSLDLLCLRGPSWMNGEDTKMPTWVPDLSNSSSKGMTIIERTFPHWRSTYNFNPILEGSTNQLLKVTGCLAGEIIGITSAVRPYEKAEPLPLVRASWVLATSSLRVEMPELSKAGPYDLANRNYLWKTLTMGLLDQKLTEATASSCFSTLWMPQGRGAIPNVNLIEWIDRNAWFRFGQWTLREWTQLKGLNSPPSQPPHGLKLDVVGRILGASTPEPVVYGHTDTDLQTFIEALDVVLDSKMKLAQLRSNTLPLCMVHPQAEVSDRIYFLRGCSIPVVLREVIGTKGINKFKFIGGAYMDDAESVQFRDFKAWATGKTDVNMHWPQYSLEDLFLG